MNRPTSRKPGATLRAGILSLLIVVATLAPRGILAQPIRPGGAVIELPSAAVPAQRAPVTPPASPPPPTLPDWARELIDNPTRDPLATDLGIVKQASADDVNNGELITYTITLENQSTITDPTSINDIIIIDALPRDVLEEIECIPTATFTDPCVRINETYAIPLPTGGTVSVTATRQLRWDIGSLLPGQSVDLAFRGTVVGQPEGTIFTNRAFASFLEDGEEQIAGSNESNVTAHIAVDVAGEATVSSVPTWFSQDLGGTISQDWGDFDRDGDLDLVLGSSLGATVYENQDGILELLWTSSPDEASADRPSYGVRWADVVPDDGSCLELVVVGDSVDQSIVEEGINYVYCFNGETFSEQPDLTFPSTYQLIRLAPGDFDGDGDMDLIAGTNAINAPCNLELYRNDGSGHFTDTVTCLSETATAAIAPHDYDEDGDLDLAIGAFPGTVQVLLNRRDGVVLTDTNPFSTTTPVILETFMEYIPYDLAWGDYDQDGYLDLAAAYPLQREVRIYHNQAGQGLEPITQTLRTGPFMTPLAVDWADFNGDGRVDLAVADSPPAIYIYDGAARRFAEWSGAQLPREEGQIWSIRGVDLDNTANLDLALSNRDGPSRLFAALAPNLSPNLTTLPLPLDTWSAGSVAWGDADGDGDLDLLLGSGPSPALLSYLYENQNGNLVVADPEGIFSASGFGTHYVAFGDVSGNGWLDIAIGTPAGVQIYLNGDNSDPVIELATPPIRSLAWADADDDGYLDLLVGTRADAEGLGLIGLYVNQGPQAAMTLAFTATVPGAVTSLAWGDFDGDYYLDFAAGIDEAPAQVFRHNGDTTFTPVWASPEAMAARSVAWADYDTDGDLDLAIGSDVGTDDQLWENSGGDLGQEPIWRTGTPLSRTTSLAWGDWNNDGFPDLALGRYEEPDVVYANLSSEPGAPSLVRLWQSAQALPTTGVAWGDRDGDGDLELAVSHWDPDDPQPNGYYQNTMRAPAHLSSAATWATPLPNNPAYLHVPRPGSTADAYYHSASEITSGPVHPTVTIQYLLHDPERDPVTAETAFEYSLDGGGTWSPATPATASPPITQTTRAGAPGVFIWDAAADDAVSDNARFRVRVVSRDSAGPIQRDATAAVSPPFRVRGLDCFWPIGVSMVFTPTHPDPGETVAFTATAEAGSGMLRAYWDFNDGTPELEGFNVTHVFERDADYLVTLRVVGPACPIVRPAYARENVRVGIGTLPPRAYLPLVAAGSSFRSRAGAPELAIYGEGRGTWPDDPRPVPEMHLPSEPPVLQSTSALDAVVQADGLAAPSANDFVAITRGDGFQSSPALNASGERVAFWSTADLDQDGPYRNPDGNIEIFLAELGSNGAITHTQITSSTGSILGGFNLSPSIDDAGDRVVFFSDGDLVTGENRDHSFEIFMAEIQGDGSVELSQVTDTSWGVNILPAISGDGSHIAFVSNQDLVPGQNREGNQEIFVAELDPVIRFIQVTSTTTGISDQPDISRDGQFVAFVSDADLVGSGDDGTQIFLADVTSGSIIQVTDFAGDFNQEPSISADGSRIACVSSGDDAYGLTQVYVSEIDTASLAVSETIQITESDVPKDQPTISADGNRVGYTEIPSAVTRQLGATSIVDLDPNTAYRSVRLGTGNDTIRPTFNSDGSAIAFVSGWDIYVTYPPDTDMSITKTSDPNPVTPGQVLTYSFTVTNNSPEPAYGAVVDDPFPEGVEASLNLELPDYIDDDNTGTGFGGGVHSGTMWDGESESLELDLAGQSLSGYFDSRVMNRAAGAFGWNSIAWLTTRPVGIQLPGNGGVETIYQEGNVDMADNVLLLHMDGPSGFPSLALGDDSGRGHDGTCSGSHCPVTGAQGRFGTTLWFDGSDYVEVPIDVSETSYAVSLWFKTSCETCGIFSVDDGLLGSAGNDRHIYLNGSRICARVWSDETICTPLGPGLRFADNEWHHVVHTLGTSVGGQQLYVDGQLLALGSKAASDFGDQTGVNIGFSNDASTDYFRGRIDEVAIFDRVLTAAEIEDLYIRGALRLRFQVRACDDAGCTGEEFVGPDGTGDTYYPGPDGADGSAVFTQDFESSSGGFIIGGSFPTWMWGEPTYGPNGAHSGSMVWATNLAGPYHYYESSYLQSPPLDLSSLQGHSIYLSWWQWFDGDCLFYPGCDYIGVDVSRDGGVNWTRVYGLLDAWDVHENVWEKQEILLDPSYAVSDLRFRFNFHAGYMNAAAGWYIDDVSLGSPPVLEPEVEYDQPFSGPGNYTHGGVQDEWQWGIPDLNHWPYLCASWPTCWGTDLNGGTDGNIAYENNANQTLTSTIISLADIPQGSTAIVEWAQAWHIESSYWDRAYAEVSINGGPWTTMWTHDDGTTQVDWTRMTYDISNAAGGTVQFRWRLTSDFSITFEGYYIDDVRIIYSPSLLDLTPPAFVIDVPDEDFFQYRAYLDTRDSLPSPELTDVIVNPRVNCTGNTDLTCILDPFVPLSPMASVSWDIPVALASDYSGSSILNTAEVSSIGFEQTPGDNASTETTSIQTESNLVLTKTDEDDPAIAGRPLAYTLSVKNNGPSDAPSVVITDTLPAGVEFNDIGTDPRCSHDGSLDGGIVTCTLGTVVNGANEGVTIEVNVGPSTRGTIVNEATIGSEAADPDTSNNTDPEETEIEGRVDLAVTKTDGPDPVVAGEVLNYTVTVENAGPSDALDVVVEDTLPAGVSFRSAGTDPRCTHDGSPNGGTVTCNLGTIAVGDDDTLVIAVDVDPATRGTIDNTATLSSSDPDEVPGNNAATEPTAVEAQADLAITKEDSPDPVVVGATLDYALTVENAGPSDATGVVVTDTLPAGVTYDSASSGCGHSNGVVVCTVGTVPAGDSTTIHISVLAPSTEGSITNNATVSADEPDPNSGNNATGPIVTTVRLPEVSFSSVTYSVNERTSQATITVLLDEAAGVEVRVDYATSDISAVAGLDYVATSGTLIFAENATSRTFSVLIINDGDQENNEDLRLSLSGAVNATIGTPNPAILTIVDND